MAKDEENKLMFLTQVHLQSRNTRPKLKPGKEIRVGCGRAHLSSHSREAEDRSLPGIQGQPDLQEEFQVGQQGENLPQKNRTNSGLERRQED